MKKTIRLAALAAVVMCGVTSCVNVAPNAKQNAEMDNTAAATQAKRTEESRLEMFKAKEAAERQRAIADKAYQKELGLNTDQFIQLKAWEIIEKKDGANIDVLVGSTGASSMWNVRR